MDKPLGPIGQMLAEMLAKTEEVAGRPVVVFRVSYDVRNQYVAELLPLTYVQRLEQERSGFLGWSLEFNGRPVVADPTIEPGTIHALTRDAEYGPDAEAP